MILSPLPIIYCFDGLEVFVSEGGILLQGHSDCFNELKIKKTVLLLSVPNATEPIGKGQLFVFIVLIIEGAIEFLLHNGTRKDYVCEPVASQDHSSQIQA